MAVVDRVEAAGVNRDQWRALFAFCHISFRPSLCARRRIGSPVKGDPMIADSCNECAFVIIRSGRCRRRAFRLFHYHPSAGGDEIQFTKQRQNFRAHVVLERRVDEIPDRTTRAQRASSPKRAMHIGHDDASRDPRVRAAARLARIAAAASREESTNVTCAAPRESDSMPSEPLPAKMSSTRTPSRSIRTASREKIDSRARADVGRVSKPRGALSRRPCACPAIIRIA